MFSNVGIRFPGYLLYNLNGLNVKPTFFSRSCREQQVLQTQRTVGGLCFTLVALNPDDQWCYILYSSA